MTNPTVWLSIVVILAIYLCVSVGLRWRKVLVDRRRWDREWINGPRRLSAILPEIERLRRHGLSGPPVPARQTPAHIRLIAAMRQALAQFAYFQRRTADTLDESNSQQPRERHA